MPGGLVEAVREVVSWEDEGDGDGESDGPGFDGGGVAGADGVASTAVAMDLWRTLFCLVWRRAVFRQPRGRQREEVFMATGAVDVVPVLVIDGG
jgi:hypothetical protein